MPHNYAVEGASAMVLVPADEAGNYTDKPIYVDGISYKCNSHLFPQPYGVIPYVLGVRLGFSEEQTLGW